MMKKPEADMKSNIGRKQTPPAPPPPPPLPIWRKPDHVCRSVTREEIDRFWRKKRMEEEDHLLAAIKAAARIRAQKMTVDDYKQFVDSLDDDPNDKKHNKKEEVDKQGEIRVGIKDWWTKSNYAYLNQPAIESMDAPYRKSSYTPYLCHYKPPPTQSYSLGVF